jgi:hypothetical protein
MMHRTSAGKLIEINKMDFTHDQSCFNKIYSLKQTEISPLLNAPTPNISSFVKQIAPKSKRQQYVEQQFMSSTHAH